MTAQRGSSWPNLDYEPVNLLGTNLGIHDAGQIAEMLKLTDHYGINAISLGTTIAYVLEYNERHPVSQICGGVTFGQYEKICILVEQTGRGELPEVGRGVRRLSEQTGEPGYAMQVKGLELPAYLPDLNPGYPWAIAGGRMSMGTYLLLAREGKTDLNYWVDAITGKGLLMTGYDMIGLCKFIGVGIGHRLVGEAVREATGLEISGEEMEAAVRRAFLLGLALERKQGYDKGEYTLPSRVF
ncbi:MAG: aldehyde ferredoxin oxidoreductase C-terminal domain-containing protein [bacterium]|nr:aldehyde ferredoxin oxidoreductase C-terminal domain-containing protein [bacterium]